MIMKSEGTDVDESSIYRWSRELDGFTSQLQAKRKEDLADKWYGIALQGVTRMGETVDDLTGVPLAVSSGVATDKYLRLTEEAPAQSNTRISVFVGVKVD